MMTRNKNIRIEVIHRTIPTHKDNRICLGVKMRDIYLLMREQKTAAAFIPIFVTN
jgi:hypothetical protein